MSLFSDLEKEITVVSKNNTPKIKKIIKLLCNLIDIKFENLNKDKEPQKD